MFKKSINKDLIYAPARYPRTEQKDIERAYARLFQSEDGQTVIAHLQTITFHRAMGAESAADQLRYLEGQRALVATIMRLVDRGRQ